MKNMNDPNNDVSLSQPFKLERERTLMPTEFRERMSARHKSRKPSAARSASHSHKSRFSASSKRSQMERFNMDINSNPENTVHDNSRELEESQFSYMYDKNQTKHDNELHSSSSHIALNEDYKFMMDNAYANYEGRSMYSIKTPPSNMQISDLMMPLDEWNSNTISEKKYTVLPSIKSPKSVKSQTSSGFSPLSISSQNNQLDFKRDKIEKEADFFADFRVNTSSVKPTPRQDPLPPIQLGEITSTKSARRLGEITATHSARRKSSAISTRLQTHKGNEPRSVFS